MRRRETTAATPTTSGPREFSAAEVAELRAIIAGDWSRREDDRAEALDAVHARAGRRRGLLLWELDRVDDVDRRLAEEVAGDYFTWSARGCPILPPD
ncbi:hypothetical protein [Nigerium sp.]|uniref:hypothetical protein n=1 Tax=Nigerium sp. TaxID=2042655 RepID=UPI0032214439